MHKANIDNLTGLWRLMRADRLSSGLWQSECWPRRCWGGWEDGLNSTGQALLREAPVGYLCPIWDVGVETADVENDLLAGGFEMGLQQRAMVLPLHEVEPIESTLTLNLSAIGSEQDAAIWAEVCGRAFGYHIDVGVIDRLRNLPEVEVLWATREGAVVATAILYHSGAVTGVHQVGVPPELQGQGIARELMWQLVARLKTTAVESLCLQASAAGEPLYLNMGFKPQFLMRSYRRI
ncbi:GNAT family N-acetyltransferase [Marinobacterium marinum]|uniref:GNAT family N-acetyltransferase n=1 Tax=Marinobacterium marinum TaxID=2756129 RepID=A0A7W2ACN2_9GAMM|nr:GNAT family N-acetyltransferase [Marinobacterium marinum]MBA4502679.1 GNAT family N-acetyltransferase [Marinobacterium marinum]